jgi:hypothetical protein
MGVRTDLLYIPNVPNPIRYGMARASAYNTVSGKKKSLPPGPYYDLLGITGTIPGSQGPRCLTEIPTRAQFSRYFKKLAAKRQRIFKQS